MIANTKNLPVVLWLKRDLRLSDNPALSLAQNMGPTIILVAIEPTLWTGNDLSKRHLSFSPTTSRFYIYDDSYNFRSPFFPIILVQYVNL